MMNEENNQDFSRENQMLYKELKDQQERQDIAQRMSGNVDDISSYYNERKSLGKISISNETKKTAPKWVIVLVTLVVAAIVVVAGLVVYRNISNGVDTSKIDIVKANAYNSKFLAYEGRDKNASEVRALLNHVKLQNGDEAKKAVYGEIEVRGISTLEEIRDGRSYVICDFTKDLLSGYINGFTIKEQANF